MKQLPLFVILGPTATGKTRVAALLASFIGGEVISADSRQVYRGMDLGTGKDRTDYFVNGNMVPHHLIDVAAAGDRFSIFDFKRDFDTALSMINKAGNPAVVCGGSGLYLETALGLYNLKEAPADEAFRAEAAKLSRDELIQMLKKLRPLHNTTDVTDLSRLIRAIEVARAEKDGLHPANDTATKYQIPANARVFGIDFPRAEIRERITQRLKLRLEGGMIKEVEDLLSSGIEPSDLIYYGLEYKYLTQYLTGELSYEAMFSGLNTAIHQFAKRQMTWFRRMEKRGVHIHWLDGHEGPEALAEELAGVYSQCLNSRI